MAENVYEGLFILDANRCARDGAKAARQVEQMIETAGGQLLVSRLWEERRLAYPIKRHRKGAYWLTYFRMPSNGLTGLNRQTQINDLVLRHLFLKIDPRLVDAILSHVQPQEEAAAPEAEQPADAAKSADAEKPAEAAEGGKEEAATPSADQGQDAETATAESESSESQS